MHMIIYYLTQDLVDPYAKNSNLSPAVCSKAMPKGQDFSLDGILSRMKTGHKIYKYNYNIPTRKIVTVKIDLNK